jgi:predicted RNase H-like HicB family nuclease
MFLENQDYPLRACKMKYTVIFHRSEEGISVSVPGLPGCWSEGDNEEQALANIQDAISDYLAAVAQMSQGQEMHEIEIAA